MSREKKLTILHLDNCPYCRKARRALDELCEENTAYRAVTVEWIEGGGEPLHRLLLRPDDLCRSGQALRGAPRRQLREDQGRGQESVGGGAPLNPANLSPL